MLFKANMVTPDFEVKGCAYIFEQLLRLDLLLVKELLHIVLVVRPLNVTVCKITLRPATGSHINTDGIELPYTWTTQY